MLGFGPVNSPNRGPGALNFAPICYDNSPTRPLFLWFGGIVCMNSFPTDPVTLKTDKCNHVNRENGSWYTAYISKITYIMLI